MASVSPIQANFSAGELSPKLLGRVDYPKYNNGCEVLDRFLPLPHGGITKTPGTRFMNEVKDSSKTTRLIRFVFSSVQAYIIEFGDEYIRFHISEGIVESSPGVAYELVSPYTEDELWDIQFTQSADVLFLVCPGHNPKLLSRTSLTSWTLTDYDNIDGPYLDINITSTTLTPSGMTGSVNITASATTGINNGTGFQTTDVGRWIRIRHSSTWGWAKITSRTSSTVVVATVYSAFGATTTSANWLLGAWSSVLGWPRTITFYEDRLFFGGNDNQPQTIWGSMSGDYYTHSPTEVASTVADDNAVVYGLASGQVNDIRFLESAKALLAGTASAEFSLSGGSNNEALTPSNVRAFAATVRGGAKVLPIRVDSAVLFVQKSKRKLREYSYDFGTDSFQAIDLTILSEHLTKGNIREMAYQQEPNSVIWICTEDGKLISLTYNREQEIISWARQTIADGGLVRSVATIPSPTESYDEVWLVVERTVNGNTVQYIEKFTEEFSPNDADDKNTAFYVDSGLIYDGPPVDTITGLDHLIGKEVTIWADGCVHPRRTVDENGEITLQRNTEYAIVGLPYTARVRTVRYEVGGNEGTAQAKIKRVHRLGIRFLNTLGVKFGPALGMLEEIPFRTTSNPMGTSPPLFTGDKVVAFNGDYDRNGQIEIISDTPTPVTILALMPEMVVHG
ncbi:MAG TPA: hypothetical protein VD999_07910 [Vitreimonas sp.]|nr:hypothetical protein [Vitreimonas sp.]